MICVTKEFIRLEPLHDTEKLRYFLNLKIVHRREQLSLVRFVGLCIHDAPALVRKHVQIAREML
jgi:hypothetical protein